MYVYNHTYKLLLIPTDNQAYHPWDASVEGPRAQACHHRLGTSRQQGAINDTNLQEDGKVKSQEHTYIYIYIYVYISICNVYIYKYIYICIHVSILMCSKLDC